MLSRMRCAFIFGTLAALTSSWLADSVAQAQTGNWVYVPESGGYLDSNTGLVWGKQAGINTWDGAVAYTDRLRTNTGFQWRLPTLAECQLAAAHDIVSVPAIFYRTSNVWTSDAKNKGGAKTAHYSFVFQWGLVALTGNNSLIDLIPMYRAFTP